jgi:hypothetical protein
MVFPFLIPAAIATASAAAQTFGKKTKGTPGYSRQGTGAMSAPQQANSLRYSNDITNFQNNPFPQNVMQNVGAPQNPWDNQELYNRQQLTGQPSRLSGVHEPFNQLQTNTFNTVGNPGARLADYMQGLESLRRNTADDINRGSNLDIQRMLGNAAQSGSLTPGSYFQNVQPMIEEGRSRALDRSNALFQANAEAFKQQALMDQGNAGHYIQQQNQAELNSSNPHSQIMNNPLYQQLLAVAPFIQGFPTSTYQTGGTPDKPGTVRKLGGLGMYLSSQGAFGNQGGFGGGQEGGFGSMYGNQPQNQWVDPDKTRGIFG